MNINKCVRILDNQLPHLNIKTGLKFPKCFTEKIFSLLIFKYQIFIFIFSVSVSHFSDKSEFISLKPFSQPVTSEKC